MGESIVALLQDYYFWGFVGFSLGSAVVLYDLTRNGLSFPLAVVVWTVALYGGLVGTRMLYVLSVNPRLFLVDPAEVFVFWRGRLSWQGGPVLGAVSVFVLLKALGKPTWPNMGCCMPGLALCHAFSRVACLVHGCCHGAPTALPWGIHSARLNSVVHPTQIYSMICEVATAAILQWLWRKPGHRKYLTPLYCMLLASHRFATEGFRGTAPGFALVPGLRFYQATSVFLFLASAAVLALLAGKKAGRIVAPIAGLIAAALIVYSALAARAPQTSPSRPASATPTLGRYLVLTRSQFAGELAPWTRHRRAEGYEVLVHAWAQAPTAPALQAWIRDHRGEDCACILLVGDCAAPGGAPEPWHLPAVETAAACEGASQGYRADALYGDLDGDGLPDTPVGRIPVQTPAQLRAQLAKVLAYETRALRADWFRAVIWAGAEGLQPQMHAVAQKMWDGLPPWLDRFFISGRPESACSGFLPDQPGLFLEAISKPAMISVIASHAAYRSATVAVHEGNPVALAVEDVAEIDSIRAAGPLFILACTAGDFTREAAEGPGLSEALLAHPGGPIAVVSASASTEPVANYFFARAMARGLGEAERIGGYVLAVQRALCTKGQRGFEALAAGDELARSLLEARPPPAADCGDLLRHDALSYGILGDPACRLRIPNAMALDVRMVDNTLAIGAGPPLRAAHTLHVDVMPERHAGEILAPDVTKQERREAFRRCNRRPVTLAQRRVSKARWPLAVRLTEGTRVKGNALRCLLFGENTCGYYVHNAF